MKFFEHLMECVSRYSVFVAGLLVSLMGVVTTYGVIMRYVFRSPEHYTIELGIMFLVWSFVLAIPYVEKTNQQLRVDVLASLFPKTMQNILMHLITPIVGLVVTGTLTWKSCTTAFYSLKISEVSSSAWAVPLFPIKIVVPVGYGILFFVLVLKLIQGIMILAKGSVDEVQSAKGELAQSE